MHYFASLQHCKSGETVQKSEKKVLVEEVHEEEVEEKEGHHQDEELDEDSEELDDEGATGSPCSIRAPPIRETVFRE